MRFATLVDSGSGNEVAVNPRQVTHVDVQSTGPDTTGIHLQGYASVLTVNGTVDYVVAALIEASRHR